MIFPLAVLPIALILNGSPLVSYNSAYLKDNRIVAPIAPLFTQIADRIAYSAGHLTIVRGDRFAQIPLQRVLPSEYSKTFVPAGTVLRALGMGVRFDAATHTLYITNPLPVPSAAMTPFNPNAPRVLPSEVFTPQPVATPRPVFTGVPRPRRTPVAVSSSPP